MPGLLHLVASTASGLAGKKGVTSVFDLNQRDALAIPAPRGGNAISDAKAPRHPSLC